jgi:hypothetical protein
VTIHDATAAYESWLGTFTPLVADDLAYKHERMADPNDPFPFFRGTYYRWAQHWPAVCGDLAAAPRVPAIGDLHVENFGTWRDTDGRLCWGVNDFDEADELPWPHDLVRLAASVRFAKVNGVLTVPFKQAAAAILTGYRAAVAAGGMPFVLEERYPELRALGMAADREPGKFWRKLTRLLADPPANVPEPARAALIQDLPADGLTPEFRARPQVGFGSLGKPRFVALVEWAGGWVAREAKVATPPATAWAAGDTRPSRMADTVAAAARAPDPFYRVSSGWVARRLAPRCSRIELGELSNAADLARLLAAMGAEAANVHLGRTGIAKVILADLDARPDGWLPAAAKAMADVFTDDWRAWQTFTAGRTAAARPGRKGG